MKIDHVKRRKNVIILLVMFVIKVCCCFYPSEVFADNTKTNNLLPGVVDPFGAIACITKCTNIDSNECLNCYPAESNAEVNDGCEARVSGR